MNPIGISLEKDHLDSFFLMAVDQFYDESCSSTHLPKIIYSLNSPILSFQSSQDNYGADISSTFQKKSFDHFCMTDILEANWMERIKRTKMNLLNSIVLNNRNELAIITTSVFLKENSYQKLRENACKRSWLKDIRSNELSLKKCETHRSIN